MRDPVFAALTAQITAVEDALTPDRVREIVAGEFQQLPVARRTLDLLVASPGLLTAADPTSPPALARLLLRLVEAGARTIQAPGCVLCGQQRPLPRQLPSGRACNACSRRLTRRQGSCRRCGHTRVLKAGPDGIEYCLRCWKDMKPDSTDRIIIEIRRHRRIAASVIEQAVHRLPSARDRRVRLMLELHAHAHEWFAEPGVGSVLFGAFYDLLIADGARLPPRRCGGCGTTRTLTERVDGKISCRRCYRHAHRALCDDCGDLTHLERLLSDGRRLCQRCTNTLEDESAPCVRCGTHRLIAYRSPTGPLCSTCRSSSQQDTCTVCATITACLFHRTDKAICTPCSDAASVDVCTICARERKCRWAGTARAVCEQCANPREPCASCGEVRLRHKRAPDLSGFLCWACTPRIIETCTGCGDDRLVNGRVDGHPYCPLCYPQQPESFRRCTRCGTVTRLVGKHCARCRADKMIREMIPDGLAANDPRIAQLRERWFLGAPSKIIYAFERGTLACTLVTRLLSDPTLRTHTFLDQIGTENQTRAVRSVLVDHGLLPPRGELLARFEIWLTDTLQTIPDPSERRVITQFARWRHLRVLRGNATPSLAGQISWRRVEITGIIEFLRWLHHHGSSLATLTQTEVDAWLAADARPFLHHFLNWTARGDRSRRLTAPPPASGRLNPQSFSDDERWRLIADVTADHAIDPHTKFAAGLLLMFGVRAAKIVQLRIEDVTITDDAVLVRLGSAPLVLPAELAPPAAGAASNRSARRMFVESVQQDWIYPGARAGHHMAPSTLNQRLRSINIPPRLARTSALIALSQQLPPVVLSRLTGLEISSAIAWSNAVGAHTGAYAAEVIERVGFPLPDRSR
ncbi:hypothetical protein [Microbacterium arborescens]|uniref:hypothetical protein n=1 Tax=Microbacterium arborescens TaxID=33883 RepID=UPI003C774100